MIAAVLSCLLMDQNTVGTSSRDMNGVSPPPYLKGPARLPRKPFALFLEGVSYYVVAHSQAEFMSLISRCLPFRPDWEANLRS